MYTMAVCDDEPMAARYIMASVTDRFQARNLPVTVDCYSNPAELERRLDSGTYYDVLFLDIDMPGLDGIELCKRFREHDGDALVVFVSNKEALVFQTFQVQPFRFVRKNHFSAEIDVLCRDLENELARRGDKWLRFHADQENAVYSINVRKLMYVEACGKYCRLYSTGKTHELKSRLKDLMTPLAEHDFIQIHRSYLVNPYYIYRIDTDTVLLDGGQELPLSRNRREAARDAFFCWSIGRSD